MQSIQNRQTSHLSAQKQLINQRINHQRFLNLKLQNSYSREFKSLNASVSQIETCSREDQRNQIHKKLNESFQSRYDHQIYFNRNKKYNYMKNIIDKYFQETKRDKWYQKPRNNPEELNLTKNYATIAYRPSHKNAKNMHQQQDIKNSNKQTIELPRKSRKISIKDQEEDLTNTLTQSRLIVQDKTQNNLQSNITQSLSFTVKNSISLPRIDQMLEDKEEQIQNMRYQSISYINNDSQSDFIKESKIRVIQNQIYFIEIVLKNGQPTHRIKTYKDKGGPILNRELKAASMGVQSIWIQYKFDPRSLISNPSYSIKELLFKARRVDAESKLYTLKTKKYYKKLTTNNCEELKRILLQFSIFMKKFEGKILNNKINTGNLYIAKNQNLRLGQWGFSSFRETHLIQSMQFQNRIQPIIKSQKEWFIPPEYLAPEIIRALAFQEEVNLMEKGSAPDIWSLGVTLFEILTIIPVWIPQKCMIHGKANPPRQGILAVGERDLKKLLKKQEKLPYLMKKVFQQQFSQQKFSEQIVEIILRCVDYNPGNRMTFDEIIQILK